MDREIVKVYVREGDSERERTLSFRPPKEVPQTEWLKRGFAIDGNSVIMSVTAGQYVGYRAKPSPDRNSAITSVIAGQYVEYRAMPSPESDFVRISHLGRPEDGEILVAEEAEGTTVVQALQEVEAWLVDWLTTLGYAVEFA